MARMIITGIPHPPENETWCTVCLALHKGEAFADPAVQERVKEGLADESKPVFAIAVSAKDFVKHVELAIAWGAHPLTGPAPVPLCGTHFPAINPDQPRAGRRERAVPRREPQLMRPDDAVVRAALKDAGVAVGARGRISDDQYAAYDALADSGAAGEFWPTADLDSPDAGNLGLPPDGNLGLPPDEPEAGPAVEAEQAPRQVRTGPTAGERARGIFGRARAKTGGSGASNQGAKQEPRGKGRAKPKAKARPEQPWRPTAGLIETAWTRMAIASGSIPALQRILAAQAPMSGVVLEAQLRGGLVDRLLLQPAVRMEERADAVTALVGVPVMVTVIAMTGKVHMMPGPDGQMYPIMRPDGMPDWERSTEMAVMGLKYCLVSWLAVTERHGADIIAQAEATVRKGKDADEIIKWIFSPPAPDQTWADVQEDAARRTAGYAGYPPPTPPPDPQAPYYPDGPPAQPPSTAFRPAITGTVLR
jgi:hypothetical protein